MRKNFPMFLLLLSVPAFHAFAQDTVIYRCTDAQGELSIQNMPCAKGSREEKRTVSAIPSLPAPLPQVPAAYATPAIAEPVTANDGTSPEQPRRLPPPVLYQCITHDQGTYLNEDNEPGSRCAPLRTVGLDGNPRGGAGEACEVIRDNCARVPDEALCEAWKKRRDETEVAWRYARRENEDRNRAEFERVQRILEESTCAN